MRLFSKEFIIGTFWSSSNTNLQSQPMQPEALQHIWNFYIELGLMERHFNEIQAGYRRLASTWMLAVLAAIGFVLSTKLTIQ